MYLEDSLSPTLSLDGEWQIQLGASPAYPIIVPSAWEVSNSDKITDGPASYRRPFTLPPSWQGATIVLEADAISFEASVRVNGQLAGVHRGMWSPFQCDVTRFVRPGENLIEIEVWKPGERFPLRETLAGFLPDVATAFGGIWQSIRLRAFFQAGLHELRILTNRNGEVDVQGQLALFCPLQDLEITAELLDRHHHCLSYTRGEVHDDQTSFRVHLAPSQVEEWHSQPGAALYWVTVTLNAGAEPVAKVVRRAGFRDVAVIDGQVQFNSAPVHLRGVLDWGWNPERICPSLSREEVLDSIAKARALGFNMIKLCLFVPDETTFDVADEEGMLLWLEMPMWLPRVTPEFRELVLREYHNVFRRLHHHPCIAVVSLGCELDQQVDAEFLHALDRLARAWFPNALHCDNSGSAEAYGGVATSLSDFYDYHFYTDPHFLAPLIHHFRRSYLPAKAWIYGEFCDADTLRDFGRLNPEPWWLTDELPLTTEALGSMRDYKQRLKEANIADQGAELTRNGRRQATAVRKFIIEQVRSDSATGGYVVTGWMDTPISTSGMVDDQRQLKFSPAEWKQFNGDCVLAIDRERRRRWVHGGDRPNYQDPFTWWQRETAEVHMLLSNGMAGVEHGRLDWELMDSSGSEIASGAKDVGGLRGGGVKEVAILNLPLPRLSGNGPAEMTLNAAMKFTLERAGMEESPTTTAVSNSWTLWAVPQPRLPAVFAVSGAVLHRHDIANIDPEARVVDLPGDATENASRVPILVGELTDVLLARVKQGGSAMLWLLDPDPRYTRPMPFWREAIHVFEPHAFWDHVPHAGYADMRFFSVATDFALDLQKLAALLGPEARLTPLWRRFDARRMTWAAYLIEVQYGAGRMFVSTLRFEGGAGCQPNSFADNPIGSWMLASLLGILKG